MTSATLRAHNLRLNPLKCIFGAEAGKFLGFMISRRGIEVDSKQMVTIRQLQAPHNPQEVQSLAGKMATLDMFISRSVDQCAPFFQTLKAGVKFEWNDACEAAFEELKMYLISPPVLAAPKLNEMLFLYLVVLIRAVSAVLVSRENMSEERVV
ncbi:unnamed protein product [Linum trigynum]|uniref:Reverse transcriptase/retrotransposon-derived protein RNase H-like domain-containing protein n=1 Tax=Linum trigynum TaxID=586398 RepID=A0AAV2GIF1_9ROSI